MSDEINIVRHVLGIEPQDCGTCRHWFRGPGSYANVYCMHPSSNWSRPLGGDPNPSNTKLAHNARNSARVGDGWRDQCGDDGKYWEPLGMDDIDRVRHASGIERPTCEGCRHMTHIGCYLFDRRLIGMGDCSDFNRRYYNIPLEVFMKERV